MKLLLATALATSLLILPFTYFAHGREAPDGDDIVVRTDGQMEFVQKASRDLTTQLDRHARFVRYPGGSGIVQVRFERGEDGRPDNVKLYRKSGRGALDGLALRAVRKMRVMKNMPSDIPANQQFLANIVVSDTVWEHTLLSEELELRERARIAASANNPTTLLAIGAIAGSTG